MDSKAGNKIPKSKIMSPTRKMKFVMSPKRKFAMSPKRKVQRGRKVTKSNASSRSSSMSSTSSMSSADSVSSVHSKKYDVPKGIYPPCFEICGYAKEIYDANRDKKSFEYSDFHKAMTMYSMVFCFEKSLRAIKGKKKMMFAWASYDGAESALSCIFDNTKKFLANCDAEETFKNEDIRTVHMKNILEILKK
jgi:hypothetical protein